MTTAEERFTDQRHEFLELAKHRYPSAPATLEELFAQPTEPLVPLHVSRLDALTDAELDSIERSLTVEYGVAHIVPLIPPNVGRGPVHPLHAITEQLRQRKLLGYPLTHPVENDPDAQARFGPPDGTQKVYDPIGQSEDGYFLQQSAMSEVFEVHNDGLGYAGLVRHFVLVLDSGPLTGGFTVFQNLVRAAQAISRSDPEAFQAMFLPDALTSLRPRGKRAIAVSSPVFYIGRDGSPQVWFRVSSDDHLITWRNHPALARARALLERLGGPFAPHSRFVHFMHPGETIVGDNWHTVHGRTAFRDPPFGVGRVLSRKLFVGRPEDVAYRHVPAVHIDARWASIFPETFSLTRLNGEWRYDSMTQQNVPVAG